MTEKQEVLLVKLILSNCKMVEGTESVYDGGYVILDIFRLIKEIDTFYKINKK